MGMFDYLLFEAPLPGIEDEPDLQESVFQTKDFDCIMDAFTIKANGELWGEQYDIEDQSDPNATGLARLAGMMTRTNTRPQRLPNFSGEVTFYTDYGPRNPNGFGTGWIKFEATLFRGDLQSVRLVEHRPPPAVIAARQAKALDGTLPPGAGGEADGGNDRTRL